MYDFSHYFVRLYSIVLDEEKRKFNVSEASIQNAIRVMKEAYLPDPSWSLKAISNSYVTNYNDPAFRCAYLHKYAMCYTGMVSHFLQMAIDASDEIYVNLSRGSRLNLCSLGGGPGTDIVGVLSALSGVFESVPCSISVIDLSEKWATTFSSIVQELSSGQYGMLQAMTSSLSWQYLGTNLLADWTGNKAIQQAVATADVVTMVKFISAAACDNDTEAMIERVFNNMKPGAMLLFIDNAAGGFDQMVQEVAFEWGMKSLYGPLLHCDYENSQFNITRFGYTSQSKTKVAFQVFQKPRTMRYSVSPSTLRGRRRVNPPRIVSILQSYNPESSMTAQARGINRQQPIIAQALVQQQQPTRHEEEPPIVFVVLMWVFVIFMLFYLFSNKKN